MWGTLPGRTNTAVRGMTRPSASSTPVSRSSSTTSRATSPSTTRIAAGLRAALAFGRGQVAGVDEEDDVVGPLPHEQRVLDRAGLRAQDAEGLVADLPAVAVRAVQQVPAPPLADAGDIGQLVAHPGGDEEAAGRQQRRLEPPGEADEEPGLDAEHLVRR